MEPVEEAGSLYKEAMRNARLRDEMVSETAKAFLRYAEAKREVVRLDVIEAETLRANSAYMKLVKRVLGDVVRGGKKECEEVKVAGEELAEQYTELARQQEGILASLVAEKARKEAILIERIEKSCELQAEVRLQHTAAPQPALVTSPLSTPTAPIGIIDAQTVDDWLDTLRVPLSSVIHSAPVAVSPDGSVHIKKPYEDISRDLEAAEEGLSQVRALKGVFAVAQEANEVIQKAGREKPSQ